MNDKTRQQMSEILCAVAPAVRLYDDLLDVGVEINRTESNAPYDVLRTCMEIVAPHQFGTYGEFKLNEDYFSDSFRKICNENRDMRNKFDKLLSELDK